MMKNCPECNQILDVELDDNTMTLYKCKTVNCIVFKLLVIKRI